MKLPSFSIGRDWKELKQFESLDLKKREIVFYAENKASIVHFKPIIEELTNNLNCEICYMTSVSNDEIFNEKNKKIHAFFIGEGAARTKFFLTLKAGILVMDMPDLETFHIKRSKIHPVHYVYIFHSMFSVHSYLRKGAVDYYDTIFCVGQHHINEIRETERVFGLKPKNLIKYGYGRLDTLMEEAKINKMSGDNLKKHILIAPSFGKDNLLERCGFEIIKILIDEGYFVTLRPHPVIQKKSSDLIRNICETFQNHSNFILETDISAYDSLHTSDLMISDWSGVAMEYAFGLEKPVLFVDVPKKINNPNYHEIPCQPIEISIRQEIGDVVSPLKLHEIPTKINKLLENNELKKKIVMVRENTVFNVGNAGKVGAAEILKIMDKYTQKE